MVMRFLFHHFSLMGELSAVLVGLILLVGLAGLAIAKFDRIPLEDAVYFAFITAFTVGFGDVTPRSRAAKIITVVTALLGMILMGVMVAIAVHALDAALEAR